MLGAEDTLIRKIDIVPALLMEHKSSGKWTLIR